jgi:phosphoribosylformylglycinamidine synthase
MASPNLASRRWVWEQYDQSVGADTVQRPGGDAAVVRVHGSKKALAITTDCTPRYCYADPVEGGKQAVAEAYRNLCAVGAKPLAITNCLNFGNPQRPEIMGQFVGCIEGMAEACRALDFPVVSGNVSLYNETKNEDGSSLAILPTPAIGGVGMLDDWEKSATIGFKAEGDLIVVVGDPTYGGTEVSQSVWLREIHGRKDGPSPVADLDKELRNGRFVRNAISRNEVTAAHDISDGGIAVALAEMALAGNFGADIQMYTDFDRSYFAEDQARYVLTIDEKTFDALLERAAAEGVQFHGIGRVRGVSLLFRADEGHVRTKVSLADLRAAHESFFPKLMDSELTPEF